MCRVDHSLLIEHEKSPFFLLSLNSAFKNFLNPSSCQCVVKVPLCFVSVLTDLPPSSPSIRYVLYRSVVSWKAALMRAASVWPFVRKGGHTIWISLRNRFFLLLYTHINVEFLYFILIFFLRIPETLKEFRNFVAVLLFNFVFVCISWHCLYATSIFHLLECIQFEIGPRVGWCTLSLVVYYKNSSCCWFMRSSSVLEAHVLRSTRLVASFHIKKTNRVKHGLVSIALTKQRT